MSPPNVYLSWPTGFSIFPQNVARPHPLPPPIKERSFRSPFGIEKSLYFDALRWQIPIFFAATYILTVLYFNGVNRRRKYQPWKIAYKKSFRYFVVTHNILLAVYSFTTFLAMLRAFVHIWPGLNNDAGAAGIADALCKMHGPRGLGDAATYNITLNIFEVKNTLIKVGYDGNPDPTDVGRMWNEGLAFWGWLFYMSKFYEVIDTAIILAKGKRSPTLQTYHHAGAMMCMWAGMRFMSPPIMMFVFLNSFIHAWMYTYYALSALGYRVPRRFKQILTSCQIAQFVFGVSYAAAHLFIQYDIPVSTPYQIVDTVQRAVSSVSSAASAASTAVSSFVESPLASASVGAMIKKLLLRAAGEEGVAERIHNDRGELLTPHIAEKIEYFNEHTYQTRWRKDWTRVNCIDTSGEAFAIYLNILYLTPLTWLFGRFFVRAYTNRGKPRTASDAAKQIGNSVRDAARQTNNAVETAAEKAGEKVVQGAEEAKKEGKAVQEQMREDLQKMRDGNFVTEKKTSQRVESVKSTAQNVVDDIKKETQSLASTAQEWSSSIVSSAQDLASQVTSSAANTVDSAKASAQKAAPETTKKVQDTAAATSKEIQQGLPETIKKAQQAGDDWLKEANRRVSEAKKKGLQAVDTVSNELDKRVPEAKKTAQQAVDTVSKEVDKRAPEAKKTAQQATDAVSQEYQKGFPETKEKVQQAVDTVAQEMQKEFAETKKQAQQVSETASKEVQKGFPETKKKAQEAADAVDSAVQRADEGSGLLGGGGLLSPKKGQETTTTTTTSSSSTSETTTSGPESEDKATQDQIIAATQNVRPGKGEEEPDTDAMGASGITIAKEAGEGENYPADPAKK